MKIGIDIGNYQVKTSEGIIFNSRIGEDKLFGSNADRIVIDDKLFYLGEGEFDIEARKFDKISYMPLLLGAIAKSTEESLVDLAIGLPVIQYSNKENVDELVTKLKRKNFTVSFNERVRSITIRNVQVLPEGVSGLLYLMSQDVNLQRAIGGRDIIVVDIGGKTTDIALIKNRKATKPTSVDAGSIDAYDSIMKSLKSKFYDAKINKEKIQDYLDKGFYYRGIRKNIDFATNTINEQFKEVYGELKLNYPISTEAVVVLGGAVKLYSELFRQHIPGVILRGNIAQDIFCNANGFKMLMK